MEIVEKYGILLACACILLAAVLLFELGNDTACADIKAEHPYECLPEYKECYTGATGSKVLSLEQTTQCFNYISKIIGDDGLNSEKLYKVCLTY